MMMKRWLLSVFLLFCAVAKAQDVKIRAVDGKTGRAIANRHLMVWLFNDVKDRGSRDERHVDLQTDAEGDALLRTDDITFTHMQVWVDFSTQCVARPNTVALNIEEVRAHGLSADNHCSKKIRVAAVPGTVIVYARESTLPEKMAR